MVYLGKVSVVLDDGAIGGLSDGEFFGCGAVERGIFGEEDPGSPLVGGLLSEEGGGI